MGREAGRPKRAAADPLLSCRLLGETGRGDLAGILEASRILRDMLRIKG
ncbi:hypothetical protein [Paracoccus aminovorans]|nr:hypothetical protein [Paracoccus aminovorans]